MSTDGEPENEDGAPVLSLVRALDAGDYERAAERTDEFTEADLAEMWTELTDSFGSLESVGDPTVDGSEVEVPLELGGQTFVAAGRRAGDRVEAFRITLSDDATALSVLTGRLRGLLSGLVDPLLGGENETSEAADRLASAQDPARRARAAVDLLVAGRYGELAAVLDPPGDGEDPEAVATAMERTWTNKVSSYEGVVRTAPSDDGGYAFVDAGDTRVRVEVVVEEGRVRGLLLTTREDVATMLASRVFRGGRFDELPDLLGGDVGDPDRVVSTAERAWTETVGGSDVEAVGEPSLDGEDAAVVSLATTDGSVRIRAAFDDRWRPSAVRLADPEDGVGWEWIRERGVVEESSGER